MEEERDITTDEAIDLMQAILDRLKKENNFNALFQRAANK